MGVPPALRLRPFSETGVLILQILVGTAELVIGLLMLMLSILYMNGAVPPNAQFTPTFSAVLLPIALFSFVFGILSFAVSILAAGNQPYLGRPQPSYSTPNLQLEYQPIPISTQQFVTDFKQTILERTESWSERPCPQCGTLVSIDANYCDSCGSPLVGLGTLSKPA